MKGDEVYVTAFCRKMAAAEVSHAFRCFFFVIFVHVRLSVCPKCWVSVCREMVFLNLAF
jgi:hypothetical protein